VIEEVREADESYLMIRESIGSLEGEEALRSNYRKNQSIPSAEDQKGILAAV
jgi:hypothetical protein